jgi:hypothetical protein
MLIISFSVLIIFLRFRFLSHSLLMFYLFFEVRQSKQMHKDSRPELVKEESVGDDHTEQDHDQVQELAEAKVEVVATEPGPEVKEVLRYRARITVLGRRKVMMNIVYTFELSRIFIPSRIFRDCARITVLVQRRKIIGVIVYTFELSRIFIPSRIFRDCARITVLVQRRKITEVIVYTFELSRILSPQEFSAIVLGSRSWGEERSLSSLCTLLNFFPHFYPLSRIFRDCARITVLGEQSRKRSL